MQKFLKFKKDVDLQELKQVLSDQRIILLRESQTTETIQIKLLGRLNEKEIRKAFHPFQIEKIYSEFPYPLKHKSYELLSFRSIGQLIKKIF